MILWDIETGPGAPTTLKALFEPPEPKSHPGEFDPDSVKYGRMKDQEKRDAKLRECREKHEAAVKAWEVESETAEEDAFKSFTDNASLDPATGVVVAIAYHNPVQGVTLINGLGTEDEAQSDVGYAVVCESEDKIIDAFWSKADDMRKQRRNMVGLNTHQFDLPFLVLRSWILGIQVPGWVFNIRGDRCYYHDNFVDLRGYWLAGRWGGGVKSSFDHIGKAMGTGGKAEGDDGSQFANWWFNDRPKAIEYVRSDVEQPAVWAERMGIR